MTLPVAILAGGLASRLLPLTEAKPKSLIEIAGKPFAEHQLDLLRRNGVRDVVFCIGHFGGQINHALGDGERFGMRIHYVEDGPRLLGTGGALRRALPLLGEAFLILYGDSYLDCDYAAVADAFMISGKRGIMTVFRNDNRWERSNVRLAGDEIAAYDKDTTEPSFAYVDYGLGGLRSAVLAAYPEDQAFDLATVYRDLVTARQLAAFEVADRFYEIGSFAGLADLSNKLQQGSRE